MNMSPDHVESYFSKYGRTFQEKIFQAMLTDSTWSAQMIEVMTPEYFELKYLTYLCNRHFGFYHKYKNFPTLQLLVSIIRDELSSGDDVILREQVIEFLSRVKSQGNEGDLEYVKEKTLDFCKKQVLKQALEDCVKAITAENYDSVLSIMKDAVSKGTPATIGHDFFEDYEARFTRLLRVCCPTGIDQLDKKEVFKSLSFVTLSFT